MSKQKINEALARWAGWTKCVCNDPECGAWFPPGSDDPALGCPDYCNDLNAVYLLEEKITPEQQNKYGVALAKYLKDTLIEKTAGLWRNLDDFDIAHASAEIRCQILVKVLKLNGN